MKSGEEEAVSQLVSQVFDEYVAPGYAQRGIDEFRSYIALDKLAARSPTEGNFVLCCRIDGELAGILGVRDQSTACDTRAASQRALRAQWQVRELAAWAHLREDILANMNLRHVHEF